MDTTVRQNLPVNGIVPDIAADTGKDTRAETAADPAAGIAGHVVSKGARAMSEIIRVSSQSRSTAVAGAIAGIMRQRGFAEVQAIGAPAVNQAVKAITIARSYLEQDGIDLVIVPSFYSVAINEQERTAIHFTIMRRPADLAGPSGLG